MRTARLPHALHRDRRGSAAVEMALLTPIISLLLFAGIDLATGFAAKLDLEQAAGRTAELATAPGTVSPNYGYLQAEAMSASGQPAANVVVTSWLECDGVVASSFSGTCLTGQQIARYVSVTITKTYVPPFKFLGLAINGVKGGSLPIQGDAVVRVQ